MRKSTAEKALSINLNRPLYGSLAEIGAGQEVSRWFFKVGGAAGTIAKAMSAYDKTFSDSVYGKEPSGRYVVETRLRKMLDHEFGLLQSRLVDPDAQKKYFFAFADTVAAKSFKYDGDCHGWMGIKFQRDATEEPSQVILHVRMHDKSNLQQQEALGILGVNLIYGAYNHADDVPAYVASLAHGDLEDRLEVNVIRFEGPAFEDIDYIATNLELLSAGLSPAVLFTSRGEVAALCEELYKKQVICHRSPVVTNQSTDLDILVSARNDYCGKKTDGECDPYLIHEFSHDHISKNDSELRNKVGDLWKLGQNVLITRFQMAYQLSEYIGLFTDNHINLVYKAEALIALFEDHRYETLEPVARVFNDSTRVFIYPSLSTSIDKQFHLKPESALFTLSDYKPSDKNSMLFAHLVKAKYLREITEHSLS